MLEAVLQTAPPEPTYEPCAVAKSDSIKPCEAYRRQYGCQFISATAANLYGLNDDFDLTN